MSDSGIVVTEDDRRPYLKVPAALLAEPGLRPLLHRNMIVLRVGLYSLVDWDDPRRVLRRAEVMARCLFTRQEPFDAARRQLVARDYLKLVSHPGAPTEYRLLPGPTVQQIQARIAEYAHSRNASDPHSRNASDPHSRNASDPHSRNASDPLYVQDLVHDLPHHPSTAEGGLEPEATPWTAVAAALPAPVAEQITARHGAQVAAALDQLRALGWADGELVRQLLGEHWPDLAAAKVPGLALLHRCEVARGVTPPHVRAELNALARVDRDAAAAAAAQVEAQRRERIAAWDAEADALLATKSDAELAALRQDVIAALVESEDYDPPSVGGGPRRTAIEPAMRAFAWGDANQGLPGPLLLARARQRASGQESTQV